MKLYELYSFKHAMATAAEYSRCSAVKTALSIGTHAAVPARAGHQLTGDTMPATKIFAKLLYVAPLALGLAATPAIAAGTAAHDHAAAPASLSLDAGRKWATDEPLRKAMSNLRGAMADSLHAIHGGKLSAAGYAALATRVNDEVGYMVSHCKLEPKADAQLHLIVAEMLGGAEAMAGKTKKTGRQGGAIKVLGALEHYGAYFDDPDWKPIRH